MVILEVGRAYDYEIVGLLDSHEEAIAWIEESYGIEYKDYLEDLDEEDSEENRDEWYSENEVRVRDVEMINKK